MDDAESELKQAMMNCALYGHGFVQIRNIDPDEVVTDRSLGDLRPDIDELLAADDLPTLKAKP
jgi:hypothetical protein